MRRRLLIASLLTASSSSWSGGALAGERGYSDEAVAEVLFTEAKALTKQGRYAEACPKFEESQRLAPGIGTEYNLADCYENTGRLASAWGTFLRVAAETHSRGQIEREQAARERARALESKLGRLVIDVTAEHAGGLVVRRDDRIVGEALWGVEVPIDQGPHVIEAAAEGFRPWTTQITARDGDVVRVRIPPLPRAPVAPAPSEGAGGALTAQTAQGSNHRTLGWIAFGASAVFLGTGILGLVQRELAVSDYNADPTCPPVDVPARPASCNERVDAANTWRTVGVVGLAGSATLAIAGAVLWLTIPSSTPGPTPSAPSGKKAETRGFGCGLSGRGVACGGTF